MKLLSQRVRLETVFVAQIATIAVLGLLVEPSVIAQSSGVLKFEVVSIKKNLRRGILMPNGKTMYDTQRGYPVVPSAALRGIAGNRFTELAATVSDLLADAYRIRPLQIVGAPSWAGFEGEGYDIVAKGPGSTPLTSDDVRLMLRDVLLTRFRLKIHFAKADMPVYELSIAKGGSKMKQAAPGPDGKPPTGIISFETTLSMISNFLDRPLVDKTGLSGIFFAKFDQGELLQERRVLGGGVVPSVFTAVKDQLGLELRATKSPFDTLVIDDVQRPTEN